MKFFVILNNQQEGPYTIAQLAEMGISSETLVWKEGMKDQVRILQQLLQF